MRVLIKILVSVAIMSNAVTAAIADDKSSVNIVARPVKEVAELPDEVDNVSWEFYSAIDADYSAEALTLADDHFLGKRIGLLQGQMKDIYVTKEAPVPGDPTTRTVIRKPVVYNIIKDFDKYFKKEVQKNLMTKDEATQKYEKMLLVAIAIVDEPANSEFETILSRHRKDRAYLLSLFDKVTIKSIY